jgi:stress-induced morphogen
LEANDLSDGCGAKFELIIASDTFEGVGLLDRQRRINEILKEEMKTIHALSLK